jgi:hypothetical protein
MNIEWCQLLIKSVHPGQGSRFHQEDLNRWIFLWHFTLLSRDVQLAFISIDARSLVLKEIRYFGVVKTVLYKSNISCRYWIIPLVAFLLPPNWISEHLFLTFSSLTYCSLVLISDLKQSRIYSELFLVLCMDIQARLRFNGFVGKTVCQIPFLLNSQKGERLLFHRLEACPACLLRFINVIKSCMVGFKKR